MSRFTGKPVNGCSSHAELAKRVGCHPTAIGKRIKAGLKGKDLEKPPSKRGRPRVWDGKTFEEWDTFLRRCQFFKADGYAKNFYYYHRARGLDDKTIRNKLLIKITNNL